MSGLFLWLLFLFLSLWSVSVLSDLFHAICSKRSVRSDLFQPICSNRSVPTDLFQPICCGDGRLEMS